MPKGYKRSRRWPILAAGLCLHAVATGFAGSVEVEEESEDLGDNTIVIGKTPFTLQGFGDINYVARPAAGGHNGFSNGALDFFVTSQLSDRWSANVELVFESDGNDLVTDLERFQFTYERSDSLRVSVGRVHNPILRWAVTNHHGVFLQTPVAKPIIARWEDEPGLWPLHFVGLVASGRRAGALGLSYVAGIGNGRGRILDEVQVGDDANSNKAVVLSLGVMPDAAPGLSVNVSGYADKLPADAGPLRERVVTASVSYLQGKLEARGEWSRIHHRPAGGGLDLRTTGWYALASRRLPGNLDHLRLYFMLEDLDVDENDPFMEGAPDEKAWTAGVRYDVSRWAAIKAEGRSVKLAGAERRAILRTQLAVNF